MIKNWIIITLVLLTIGCDQKPKKNIIDVNSRQVEIDFAHISISLPKHFYRSSTEELTYAIENADSSEISESDRLERLDQIETFRLNSLGVKYYLYLDTTDINNTIIFRKGKYLKLDKAAQQYILSDTERSLKSREDDINFKRLDTQFFTGEELQILKQKFEVNRPEWISYTTLYIVTTRSNTFQIIVERTDEEDYEDRVTKIRVDY
ncbi:MAG TPA: hypothetical protein PLJ60_03470 [Chryseolinea sp.]|nr:hypothetical protein [Chryseolinea sp.]HPM29373.1 hypothetical protein [Chryseolinea sp.]